jgi:hypothetical protein
VLGKRLAFPVFDNALVSMARAQYPITPFIGHHFWGRSRAAIRAPSGRTDWDVSVKSSFKRFQSPFNRKCDRVNIMSCTPCNSYTIPMTPFRSRGRVDSLRFRRHLTCRLSAEALVNDRVRQLRTWHPTARVCVIETRPIGSSLLRPPLTSSSSSISARSSRRAKPILPERKPPTQR